MQSDPGAGAPHTGGNDDEVWRDLVARLEEREDAFMDGPDANQPADPKSVSDFDPLGVWRSESLPHPDANDADADEGGPRDYDPEDLDDEFVPEEPPSLSNTEPAIMLSWIAAAGGPLFLLFSAIFWRQAPMLLIVGVIAAFLAGAGYLLFRLPNHRDDDGGDGAVV
ncbi:hypothetical protein MB46_08340 [Arthrobacter alpinus]|uniref:hypothetical protein n=1 Tax=Arthrobacter alpinus TaxID=656366 RepID=UPI0005C8085A|nr:hypothetical protein [Arthrobacter alpinus]ALV45499.1 hypothetical protein MB46_08340 [Arthrobacter alpinus]